MAKQVRNTAIIEALGEDIRNFGIKKVAPELDKEVSSLYAELNPYGEQQKGKVGYDDAIEAMRLVGVRSLVLAANSLGYGLVPLVANPDGEDLKEEVIQAYSATNEFLQKANDPNTPPQELAILRQAARKEMDDVEAVAKAESRNRGASGMQ